MTWIDAAPPHSELTALLGPTNTGKTHRAIMRMLEHRTGMLGLPLRLLAREVYDRLTAELGQAAVALVTGEEKRIGRHARYWVCTVEAMPMTIEVDFLAVDEIQLASHPQRGHVFTDRLLSARGRIETWFLGAATMRPLIARVLPTARVESQARLSTLRSRGQTSVGALPARSAVVAFNTNEVYRLAELLCRRKGGAAVVQGALSPRARNAQVAMYESGEVDYLVATDAIGMGLNLSLRHVAFAGLRKFDGRDERPLDPAELGQIAGRAGRHLEDGSFGTLAPVPPMPEPLRRRIEQSRFDDVRKLTWRNDDLCLNSLAELESSLTKRSRRTYFSRPARSSDLEALQTLRRDADVSRRAARPPGVETLWQACQIPDYDRGLPQLHAALVKEVFLQLTSRRGVLAEDWLDQRMSPLSDVAGDLDALTARITSARTWTYLCNQSDWVEDAHHWRHRARELEHRLSDALHDKLVERFVQRRKSTIAVDASAPGSSGKPSRADDRFAALLELKKRLEGPAAPEQHERRVEALITAPHHQFHFDAFGRIAEGNEHVGRLTRGTDLLRPEVRVDLAEVTAGQRLRLTKRLLAWSRDLVEEVIAPLRSAPPDAWSPAARGLLYQLEQNLGSLRTDNARGQVHALTSDDRQRLESLGVVLGPDVVYLRRALDSRARRVRLALSQVNDPHALEPLGQLNARVSFSRPGGIEVEWLERLGFVVFGGLAVRADMAHRVSQHLRSQAGDTPFRVPAEYAQWLGCSRAQIGDVLEGLGYRRAGGDRRGHHYELRRKRHGGSGARRPPGKRRGKPRRSPVS